MNGSVDWRVSRSDSFRADRSIIRCLLLFDVDVRNDDEPVLVGMSMVLMMSDMIVIIDRK